MPSRSGHGNFLRRWRPFLLIVLGLAPTSACCGGQALRQVAENACLRCHNGVAEDHRVLFMAMMLVHCRAGIVRGPYGYVSG